MKIIFVSATCSPKQYTEICKNRKIPMLDSSQKFFDMFLRGLAEQQNVKVECICVPPVSHGTYPGLYMKKDHEEYENITYYSVGFINYPVMKSLTAQRAVKSKLKKLIKSSEEETYIVADPLLLEGAVPVVKMGEKYNKKTIGFLTDLPDFADECDEHGLVKTMMYRSYNKKCNQLLKKFSQYVFLTEAMNETVNLMGKPWLLMECLVDASSAPQDTCEKTKELPLVLYAGKLHKQFGMEILAEATKKVKHECMFQIYGDGNYREELEKRANIQSNLCVHGIVPVGEVVMKEMESTLLVNPRTSQGEFTKYSFPSKTAEYMLTGVPIVMFKLPGIPSEYDEFLYYATEETSDSLAQKLDEVLSLPGDELISMGKRAQEFIIREKNHMKQAKRFVDFCKDSGVQ